MESFETYRQYLFSVAYSMLGSAMDAEDMVQETYLRYQSASPIDIRSLKAYLVTILTRLCMDQLHLARRQREVYVGPWLPEPILTKESAETGNPEKHVDRQESISLAFLVLLEQLQPFERAVFLLREAFDYDFAEIAILLEKSEAACRRSFSRARQHLQKHRPRFHASSETHQHLLNSYIRAVETGEVQTLISLLSEDVVLWADGGGKVRNAALHPIRGRDKVARFSIGSMRFLPEGYSVKMAEVNSQLAAIIRIGGQTFSVLTIEVAQEQIQVVRVMANPEKLTRV